ncbi:polysaccharide biosynthesis tyrosine autokinase [bacterium]|nr:polysaccharide biosynthesis tyrosine autokinase [bacterium]
MVQTDTAGRTTREFNLINFWEIILRRKYTILPVVAAALIITTLQLAFKPPVFVSSATFMLESRDTTFEPQVYYFQENVRPLAYYESILRSNQFCLQLADTMRKTLPSHNQKGRLYEARDVESMVYGGLNLRTGDYEDMIRLTAKANDRILAFTAAMLASYLLKARSQELDREELSNAVLYIEQQKTMAIEQLEAAEKAIQMFKDSASITVLQEGGVMGELQKLESQLTDVQTQKQLALANLRAYENRLDQIGRTVNLPASAEPVETANLRREVADLEERRSSAPPGSDEQASLDRLLEEKKRALVTMLLTSDPAMHKDESSDDYQALKGAQEGKVTEELNVYVLENRERYYQAKISDFKNKHPNLTDNTIQYMRLIRSKTVAENLYNFLLEHGEESKIKAATGTGGLRLVDTAVLPNSPIPVNLSKELLLGLIFGLGLGFGAALLQEYLDHSIKSSSDITRALGLPVMGQIPEFNDWMRGRKKPFIQKVKGLAKIGRPQTDQKSTIESKRRSPLILGMAAKSPAMEAYRSLRANLQFASVDSIVHTLTVSSPAPSEGKSVTSANLAIAFALLGDPVILVDADMRKPKQHRLFKTPSSPGLSDMLIEDLPLKKVLRSTEIPNLKLIPSGRIPPNPAEILASQKMLDLCNALTKEAKVVLFDTPPILPVSDAVILGSRTQGLLLVFLHEVSVAEAAIEAIGQLEKSGTRILGAVLNGVRFDRMYGYYKYYGKHYYSYY